MCVCVQSKTSLLSGGLQEDEFERSLNMSSYLVAVIVADFTCVSRNVSNTLVPEHLSVCL